MAAPRRKPADRDGASQSQSASADDSPSFDESSSPFGSSHDHPNTRPPIMTKTQLVRRKLWPLLPPIMLTLGLALFATSFFLSRTSFDHRSSCSIGAAGDLLHSALGLGEEDVEFLRRNDFLSDGSISEGGDVRSSGNGRHADGCWVPRRVDSMAILVVDALRFDFARDHLPLSIGSRLFPSHNKTAQQNDDDNARRGASKLYQFVADPPTVTMQRLKGLTTGGLPTFADISGSFGGASIDEDSWVEQLKNVPWDRRRHLLHKSFDDSLKAASAIKDTGRDAKPHIAFVGDDTWVDLFPTQFDDCHPFPSFNTRDLDTVDNGCLDHLPRLLDGMVGLKSSVKHEEQMKGDEKKNPNSSQFELIVTHFLGVDHVGHTYGPNNPHMDAKLHQMDVMLSDTLNTIDAAPKDSCIVALVLGDHGMTEDGNHGGGTSEEVNAGLFVHFSPGCNNNNDGDQEDGVDGKELDAHSARAFDSIHQIDLVPTISFLLGLPIPYANIGGLVPDLLPTPRSSTGNQQSAAGTPHIATALALNAAQVWNYLDTYSKQSRDLPTDRLKELKELLDSATLVFRDAIHHSRKLSKEVDESGGNHQQQDSYFDSTSYRQACALFKLFLAESTDLGKQVWTQFNEQGMMFGIGILVLAWILAIPLWKRSVRKDLFRTCFRSEILNDSQKKKDSSNEFVKGNNVRGTDMDALHHFRRLELVVAIVFMIFQCGVLTFSNSYIEHEREIVTFFLAVLCLLVFRRWYFASGSHFPNTAGTYSGNASVYLPLVVVLCSRANDVFITGHGLDPSIRLHAAHHPVVFLSSLGILAFLRLRWLSPLSTPKIDASGIPAISLSALIDIIAIFCLAGSWCEKRTLDQSRNGFTLASLAMAAVFIGFAQSMFSLSRWGKLSSHGRPMHGRSSWVDLAQLALFRAMLFVVIVTGPSASSSAVFIVIQCAALRLMMESFGLLEISAPVLAAIWRLAIRHVFFATNHHCSFNRLQFSAAFVATSTFEFHIAGTSLFMNTFGWEVLGSTLVLVYSRTAVGHTQVHSKIHVWDWFRYFQWTEMLASCMSVSVMKRHLMVWAIFAPRFMFAAVFTVVCLLLWVLDVLTIAPILTVANMQFHKSKQQRS